MVTGLGLMGDNEGGKSIHWVRPVVTGHGLMGGNEGGES